MLFFTSVDQGDAADKPVTRFVAELGRHGLRVAGVVQISVPCEGDHPCDMDLKVLPEGPVFRISQPLGKQSRGCRLDPDALEAAVVHVSRSLENADVLVLNKFGRHEAEGHGFRQVIAEAMARDIPVIVGLNGLNKPAFLEFAGGLAHYLPPDADVMSALSLRECAVT
jgi:nucleoside-triphosphatase THEP1